MDYINREILASTAIVRWTIQYHLDEQGEHPSIRVGMQHKLAALGPNPKPWQVDEAIGNKAWTTITCDSCQKSVEEAVLILGRHHIEYATCFECLQKGVAMIKHERCKRSPENT